MIQHVCLLVSAMAYQAGNSVFLSQQTSTSQTLSAQKPTSEQDNYLQAQTVASQKAGGRENSICSSAKLPLAYIAQLNKKMHVPSSSAYLCIRVKRWNILSGLHGGCVDDVDELGLWTT